ncbi:alcohol dehydrogenase catalytic domain-containing protein [Phycisphaeraceae bacterium D3-23]
MRAIVLKDAGAAFDPGFADPSPPAGEVLIAPTRLCAGAADVALVQDAADGRDAFTGVMGHAFVGVVEAVGKGVDKANLGRRVVGEINCVCGACDLCRAGLKEHCRRRTVLGRVGRDGCFAERFALPAINLHTVPENVDDDGAVFAGLVASAYQILRQLTIQGRPYLTVLGDGPLGLVCAQVLSRLNATVRCIGHHEAKLALCEKWGVKHRPLADVGLRQDQDIVVDCTGKAAGLATAMAMVRPRGTVVLKSLPLRPTAADVSIDLSPIVRDEVSVVGSRCGPMGAALEALSAGDVDVVSLISRRMKLADGAGVLEAAAKPGALAVLMEV